MTDLTIPEYEFEEYQTMIRTLDPIEEVNGYSVKRGDAFKLGPLNGSKVRQCLHVVYTHLDQIRRAHNNGILTGAGLPSPQTCIVAGVAKYFGLKCAITTPRYPNGKRDFSRINSSLAQHFGATVYGVGNPNPSGYEKDARELVKELGYYQIKFGMVGDVAMLPVIWQVQNVPDYVKRIVIISGSGLSALSIMQGIAQYEKSVEEVVVVKLSGHFDENKAKWYDPLPLSEKFKANLRIVQSDLPYRTEYKKTPFDCTYESKAWKWLTENVAPSRETLFWVVGSRVYDLDVITPIDWHQSKYEQNLRQEAPSLPI